MKPLPNADWKFWPEMITIVTIAVLLVVIELLVVAVTPQ